MTKRGFTLAEVLITLGIIGVVAAMTLPTLIANTNSKKFASQFKKSISTLKQAVLLADAHYSVNLSNMSATCKTGSTDTIDDMTVCGLFNTTLAGATFIPQETISKERMIYKDINTCGLSSDAIGYTLADGSSFIFTQHAGDCTADNPCCAFIDVNGKTLPNKEVSGIEKTSYYDLLMPAAYAESSDNCEFSVPSDSTHMTDVYPIYMYGQEIIPATQAAKYVLTGTGNCSEKELTPEEECEARGNEHATCAIQPGSGECLCSHSGGADD